MAVVKVTVVLIFIAPKKLVRSVNFNEGSLPRKDGMGQLAISQKL